MGFSSTKALKYFRGFRNVGCLRSHMGLFLPTCYICDKKQLGNQLFHSRLRERNQNQQGHRGPSSSPHHVLLEQLEIKILVFARPPHTIQLILNNTIPNLYSQGSHHSPVFVSRSIFLQFKKIWDAGRRWAKYVDRCLESKIKIQTQYLLEHTDLSEVALNEEMAQVAQTCNARKVPGAGVQELGSCRTESAC